MELNNNVKTKEKLHIGSISIFIGLIILFAGNGKSLEIADDYLFFVIAIGVNLMSILYQKGNFSFTYISFVLLYFVGITWAYHISGVSDRGTALTILLFLILILTSAFANYTKRDISILINGVIISSVIFSILVLFNGTPYLSDVTQKYSYTQTFGNRVQFEPNYLSIWIFAGFQFCIYKLLKNKEKIGKNKITILYIMCALITMIGMLRTGCRSVLISLIVFVICLFCLIKNKKIKKYIVITGIIFFLLLFLVFYFELIPSNIYNRLFKVSYNDGSNQRRILDWLYGLKAMIDHPFGMGPINTSYLLYSQYGYRYDAHNTYVTFGMYFGILGLILFILLTIMLLKYSWKYNEKVIFSIILSSIIQWNILACQCTVSMWIILLIVILIISDLKKNHSIVIE